MGEVSADGDGVWRERAEQLQHALDTRIVIEQAKGMLRERFGLDLAGAFGLLRSAARGNGLKLHAVAAAVTESFATRIRSSALARQPESFKAMSREERVLETEAFFRNLNLELARYLAGNGGGFLCECANPHCNVELTVTPTDLRMLHSRMTTSR